MNKLLRNTLILVALLAASAFFLSAGAVAERTLFVYITGSDLESRCGAASEDLAEMIEGMPDDGSLTVYALTGGANEWQTDIPADANYLWQVTNEGLVLIREGEERSMGDAATLRDFLCEAAALAPDGPKALVLWDHGGGPLAGVCLDERFPTGEGGDCLLIAELEQALAQSPFAAEPLEFIGFDACLMCTAEVACAVAPYARYMVASQEPEPANGWDWRVLGELGSCADGAAAGAAIVRSYAEAQADRLAPATLSCLDLAWAERVSVETGRLFSALEPCLDEAYASLAACRSDVKAMAMSSPAVWDLIDLRDLADLLEEAGIADVSALREALDGMVVCSWANEPYTYGLSIYYPFENKQRYSQPWSLRYDDLAFSEGYRSYLRAFSTVWLSASRISWRDEAAISAFAMNQRTLLRMPLEGAEAEDIAHARYIVLEDGSDGEYRLLYASEDLRVSEQAVSAQYQGEALYMLDDGGGILAGPLTWRRTGEGLAVGAILEGAQGRDSVYLLFQEDADGTYALTDVYTYQDGLDMFTVSSLWPERGDDLVFAAWYRVMPDKDAPYENWPYGENVAIEFVTVPDGPIRLAFLPLPAEGTRAALFELTDLQANTHLSSLIELPDISSMPLAVDEQTAQACGCALSLESAQIVTSPTGGLRFALRLEAPEGAGIQARLMGVALDSASFPDERVSWEADIPAGGSAELELRVSANALEQACVREVRTLSVILRIDGEDAVFSFALALDAGMVSTGQDEAEALVSAAGEALRCEILEIGMNERGVITVDLRLENMTDRLLIVDGADYSVNGMEAYGNLSNGQPPYILLPHGQARCSCLVWPADPVSGESYLSDPAGLERVEIRIRCGEEAVAVVWE